MIIDVSVFDHVYKQLLFVTHTRYPDAVVSFTTGMWEDEEGYKRHFWEDARKEMALDTWASHKDDPMFILSKATQPFFVLMRDTDRQQNLVSNQNSEKLIDIMLSSSSSQKEAAAILYDVFFENDDEASFDKLSKLLSRKSMNDPISIASLYFFLKDKDLYVTARKEGTGDRLARLGLNSSCLQRCTWAGYLQYVTIVKELLELLRPYHPDATLLDAQSFLWMLHYVTKDTPEYDVDESINPSDEKALAALSDERLKRLAGNTSSGPAPLQTVTTAERVRNPYLPEIAKRRANGVCQLCGNVLDFTDAAGRPFLEAHHIIPLGDDGPDELDNLVALCPNCHRKMHVAKRNEDIERLQMAVKAP